MPPRLDALHRTQLKSWGICPAGSKFGPEGVRNRHGLTSAPDYLSQPTGAVPALGWYAALAHTRGPPGPRLAVSDAR